jgi:hypothetical protein
LQTTTTHASQAERSPAASLAAKLNNPWVGGGIAFVGWLAFILIRLAMWGKGQISYFIGVGVGYAQASRLPPGIHQVLRAGYDGQFYYRLALNPFNWNHTAYGITMDQPYRYTRIGYPVVVWLFSLGQHAWVPVMLVVVNLLAVTAMAVLGGVFARQGGRSALWGLLFVAYFGMVISVGRDTAEPLAEVCMLAGLLCYRRGRYLASTALIAYGVITRETILLLPAAIALTRFWEFWKQRAIRPAVRDLVWIVPAASYLVLEVAQKVFAGGTGGTGATSDASRNITAPFAGLGYGLYEDFRKMSWTHMGLADYNLLEFVALAAVVVTAAGMLRKTTAPLHERAAFGLFTLQAVMASSLIWASWFGELRNLIETYLFAIIILLATPQQYVSKRRLGWLAAIAVVALLAVARRRVLFQ